MAHGTTIRVLYFAQVAELIGKQNEELPLDSAISANAWLQGLSQKYPAIRDLKQINMAINQEHIKLDHIIQPGDEIAVFEPVTGG